MLLNCDDDGRPSKERQKSRADKLRSRSSSPQSMKRLLWPSNLKGLWLGCESTGNKHGWTCPQLPIHLQCGPSSPRRGYRFCANALKCARWATDRDFECVSAVRMNAWICALLTNDRDLESSRAMKRVNAWTCAPPTTDHNPASVIFDKIWNICNFRNFLRTYCFSNSLNP